ncbi:interleukin-7 receptor subunit alpha-like [Menidia menidia]
MRLLWRIAALLLMLGTRTQTQTRAQNQSGDGDPDSEPALSCWSHISVTGNSLSCRLQEDDEDEDATGIQNMTLCFFRGGLVQTTCLEAPGATLSCPELHPLMGVNLTVQTRGGGRVWALLDLMSIVRPRSPWVSNVTFEANKAVIHIQTPYQRDYLKVENQMFQLHIWTAGVDLFQNVSSRSSLQVDLQHLLRKSRYQVRVRSLPQGGLRGSWSPWSPSVSFLRPADPQEEPVGFYLLALCPAALLVLTFCLLLLWKSSRTCSSVWPSVPHPKRTVVQICKPSKGLLLDLNPEVYSLLRVGPPPSGRSVGGSGPCPPPSGWPPGPRPPPGPPPLGPPPPPDPPPPPPLRLQLRLEQ